MYRVLIHLRPSRQLRRAWLGFAAVLLLSSAAPVAAADPAAKAVSPTAARPSIVGGVAVPNGKYKFQAALLGQTFGEDDWARQYCGATLISPYHVLTAAHCVDFIGPGGELELEDLRIVVGRTVLTSVQGQKRRAVDIAIHPRWDPNTARFDVAVITLRAPIDTIAPIQLVTPGTDALQRPGARLIATGWGNTKPQNVGPGPGGVHFPIRLREVSLTLLSQPECATAYTIEGSPLFYRGSMICAGRTGKDTCQGDSGGPLFVPATTGGYIQLGITSWGGGCGDTGFPGIYTKLSNLSIGNFVLVATGGVPV